MLDYNKNLKKHSQSLRSNMTDCEFILWLKLKGKQLKNMQFYRQKIIGNYIVDFYCAKAKLIIELDGGQHYTEEGIKKDKIRDKYLTNLGLKVLRFSDNDIINNIDSVIKIIYENL